MYMVCVCRVCPVVSGNQINSEGVSALVPALCEMKHLTALDLESTVQVIVTLMWWSSHLTSANRDGTAFMTIWFACVYLYQEITLDAKSQHLCLLCVR